MDKLEDILANNAGYEFGFHDDVDPIFSTNEGLTEDVVRQISRDKSEPEWMLNYRLQAFHVYEKMPFPSFGPDLSGLDLKNMKYYQKYTNETHDSWNEVPTDVRDTFDKIGIPEA
ncbi:ABC superfamily ATP binding cassette transporter, membrane protein [Paucilactobacillus suebicus DSM 5007 = KCTC 3549]|uniref:ABC superfamily ATP binding cassette transporter, membrane protein n=1 Tax=Paucilactobacillus suebicus DSM 5007 = KCTC 3549 TaxID=1423807 RepID=A0A0R1WB39_9LACO|nr:ABC superfamily ATP binding cassette transporter, membrane protein [Paucilactobacillus suebicus DSM 5007 = KCTC 3549]